MCKKQNKDQELNEIVNLVNFDQIAIKALKEKGLDPDESEITSDYYISKNTGREGVTLIYILSLNSSF